MNLKSKFVKIYPSLKNYFPVFTLLFCTSGFAQTPTSEWWQFMREIKPETYLCHQTAEAIEIDGKMNEMSWDQAPWTHYFVDLGPFQQYVTIDLEKEYEIYAIVVWHYHQNPRAYIDVVVQVADDPDFVMNVRTLFNNDHDNSAGMGVGTDWHYVETAEGKLIDAKGEKARYVRLHSKANSADDSSHYIEVEVFGK